MSAVRRKNLLNDLRRTTIMNKDHDSFLFDEKQTKKIMRKARFWSTVKIIGITIIITPIILLVLWYGFRQLSLHNAQKTMDDMRVYKEISAPNVHISNQTSDYNLFGGQIQTDTYKVLGDRPYIWEPLKGNYNLFGTLSKSYGSYGAIQLEASESLKASYQLEQFNTYTGDREMFFYHPEIKFDVYKDSISELNQFEENTLVELGISFDQAYSPKEIKSKLPADVQVVWWWVDAYSEETLDYMKKDQQTVAANSPFIYGFNSEQSKSKAQQSQNDEVDSFIRNIENLRESKNFKWETDQVYQSLIGENGTLEKSDVKIIGAVTTGTSEQLESLQGQTYIKASTFGVISDRK